MVMKIKTGLTLLCKFIIKVILFHVFQGILIAISACVSSGRDQVVFKSNYNILGHISKTKFISL